MSVPDELNTITSWRDRLHDGIDAAVRRFNAARAQLPPAVRKAVFAVELDDEAVVKAFTYAKANYDRPLSGVPYFLKDNFEVTGLPTGAGSAFLAETRPVPKKPCRIYEAMHALGAVFAGKTQMNEFASNLSGENPFYGDCPNPMDFSRLSGGSSSGSAFAVSAGLAPFAFGTDTAGSVRVPAAFCGVFGLRIQPGPLSREGVFPWAPSYDAAGWFASDAADLARLCAELGYGTPRTEQSPKPALWCGSLFEMPEAPLREGYRYLADCLGAVTDRHACELLRPHLKNAVKAFDVLRDVECYAAQKPIFEKYADRYSPALRERLESAGTHTAAEIEQAKHEASDLSSALHEVFSDYDQLVWPVTPCTAPKMGEFTPQLRRRLVEMNAPVSLARLPALVLPTACENGLTGGLQCVFASEVRMDIPGLLHRTGYLGAT